MKTLLVPKFKPVFPVGLDHCEYLFEGYVKVKIKNKPDDVDYNKVASVFPGFTQGYCEELYTIGKTLQPICVTQFYDPRQTAAKKFKKYFITIQN